MLLAFREESSAEFIAGELTELIPWFHRLGRKAELSRHLFMIGILPVLLKAERVRALGVSSAARTPVPR